MSKEPEENIRHICKDCLDKVYPNKGKFTKEQVMKAQHIKKQFYLEHMWIRVVEVTELGVRGFINNDPARKENPQCGTAVFVEFKDIEEIFP